MHSHLHYVPFIYGLVRSELLGQLQSLQNRALKHCYKLPFLTPTKTLFQTHAKSTLPISGITHLSSSVLLHKIRIGRVETNTKPAMKFSNLRSSGDFVAATFNSDYLKRDIHYHGVQIYNKIPNEIRKLTDIDKFKKDLKQYLLARSQRLVKPSKFSLLQLS